MCLPFASILNALALLAQHLPCVLQIVGSLIFPDVVDQENTDDLLGHLSAHKAD